MREIFKAYSLSFLIHSLLLFGFFLLTQRLVPSEKRLIEIDLSLENVQRQPSQTFPKKPNPCPARPPQTQPVPQATIPPPEGGNKKLNRKTAKAGRKAEAKSKAHQSPQRQKLEKFKPLRFKPPHSQKKRQRDKLQNTQGREEGLSKPKKFPKSLQVKREKGKIFRLKLTKAWKILQDPHPHLQTKVEG
jgi:hypothetical protein